MKKIIQFLGFLVSFITSWRIIFPVILIILGAITNIFKFLLKVILINLPLWIIVVILILAFYPIANFIKFLFNKRNVPYFSHNGLLWKKPLFSFMNPQAYCPINKCGREVLYIRTPPKPLQVAWTLSEINNIDNRYHYKYECPNHGKISGVPDEDLLTLQTKARLAMKR